jgi:hypothetical protein
MKMGKYLLTALMVLGIAGMVYASPVGLTSEADAARSEWSYEDMTLSLGFVGDFVSGRNIDISGGEFTINAFMGRLGVNVADRFNFYVDLGSASDMEYSFIILGEKYKIDYDDDFMWGIGANALVKRWDNGLEVGVHASYREVDTSIDKVDIDNTSWPATSLTAISGGTFEETQAAIELAWRNDVFIPYVGIKYSDVDAGSRFTLGGTVRNAAGRDSDENTGAFIGLTILPKLAETAVSERFAINIEGRFIDEEAISTSITYKF